MVAFKATLLHKIADLRPSLHTETQIKQISLIAVSLYNSPVRNNPQTKLWQSTRSTPYNSICLRQNRKWMRCTSRRKIFTSLVARRPPPPIKPPSSRDALQGDDLTPAFAEHQSRPSRLRGCHKPNVTAYLSIWSLRSRGWGDEECKWTPSRCPEYLSITAARIDHVSLPIREAHTSAGRSS